MWKSPADTGYLPRCDRGRLRITAAAVSSSPLSFDLADELIDDATTRRGNKLPYQYGTWSRQSGDSCWKGPGLLVKTAPRVYMMSVRRRVCRRRLQFQVATPNTEHETTAGHRGKTADSSLLHQKAWDAVRLRKPSARPQEFGLAYGRLSSAAIPRPSGDRTALGKPKGGD